MRWVIGIVAVLVVIVVWGLNNSNDSYCRSRAADWADNYRIMHNGHEPSPSDVEAQRELCTY